MLVVAAYGNALSAGNLRPPLSNQRHSRDTRNTPPSLFRPG
jgi:hypothetical protein